MLLISKFKRLAPLDRTMLAGVLIACAMVLSIAGAFSASYCLLAAGIAYWVAIALLLTKVNRRNLIQSTIMILIGLACLTLAQSSPTEKMPAFDAQKLLSGHAPLISMLVAVSFLVLIANQANITNLPKPTGRKGVINTLLGVHILGAVINLSSIFMVADSILGKNPINKNQAIALVRGFTSGAFWSPFFAATAVALYYAPDAHLSELIPIGVGFSLCALALTYFEIQRELKTGNPNDFQGFPLKFSTLWIPVLLAFAVFLVHYFYPTLSVLTIISLLTPLLVILILLVENTPIIRSLYGHITERLPKMANEILLFQSAGILGYGLQQLAFKYSQWPLFETFGTTEACVSLLLLLCAALAGIHPLVGIALLSALVMNSTTPDHTLLALVILASWSLGAAAGPMSGNNLAVQARYGVSSFTMMRWNIKYAGVMAIVVMLGLEVREYVL